MNVGFGKNCTQTKARICPSVFLFFALFIVCFVFPLCKMKYVSHSRRQAFCLSDCIYKMWCTWNPFFVSIARVAIDVLSFVFGFSCFSSVFICISWRHEHGKTGYGDGGGGGGWWYEMMIIMMMMMRCVCIMFLFTKNKCNSKFHFVFSVFRCCCCCFHEWWIIIITAAASSVVVVVIAAHHTLLNYYFQFTICVDVYFWLALNERAVLCFRYENISMAIHFIFRSIAIGWTDRARAGSWAGSSSIYISHLKHIYVQYIEHFYLDTIIQHRKYLAV